MSKNPKINKIDLMHRYWASQKTAFEIAEELNLSEWHIQKAIRDYGLQKSQNGIRRKGRKGFEMSEEQKNKRKNQPHAKKVSQICPKTFRVIKIFDSQNSVKKDGFSRENVRRAIKTGGLHMGYLWTLSGLEKPTITIIQKRGNIEKKIQMSEYKKPTKKSLKKLYIEENLTAKKCAIFFKCHQHTIAKLASEYNLKKRNLKLNMETLKELYLVKNLSIQEIADKTGYTKSTIATYLSKNKIKKQGKK